MLLASGQRPSKYNYLLPLLLFFSCAPPPAKQKQATEPVKKDTIQTLSDTSKTTVKINDSLNALASIIGGTYKEGLFFKNITVLETYKQYSKKFSRRWAEYDSTRIKTLKLFREKELNTSFNTSATIFYPFSGPDMLYAGTFFEAANKYILVGLEPLGTFPDLSQPGKDSLSNYFSKLDEALYAILRFSFFRTESMRSDLHSGELDGTLHLLLLFLNRTNHSIVSIKPFVADSTGTKSYCTSFNELNANNSKTKGAEIHYLNDKHQLKELNYLSVNLSDASLVNNRSFINFIQKEDSFNVYLKGASYLLHKPNFSTVRNIILKKATAVIQDDSGMAIRYFLKDTCQWQYKLYGEYSKPIAKFARSYQPLLDSLYRKNGAKPLDFGLGYNYRDKNSNFMIAKKIKPL